MPRDLHSLPRAQVPVNVASCLPNLPLYRRGGRIKIDIVLVGMRLQIGQTLFQFGDWLFEIEWLYIHGASIGGRYIVNRADSRFNVLTSYVTP